MNLAFLIIIIPFIIPFVIFMVSCIKEYFLTKQILLVIKDIDYKTWVYLTSFSFSLPGIKYFLWVNPSRFRKFVQAGDDLNNARLQDYIRRYRNNRTMGMICWIILMVEIISLSFLGLLLKG